MAVPWYSNSGTPPTEASKHQARQKGGTQCAAFSSLKPRDSNMDRREFLTTTGTGIIGSALAPGFMSGTALAAETGGMQLPGIHLFSKHLQFLDYKEMAEAAVALAIILNIYKNFKHVNIDEVDMLKD